MTTPVGEGRGVLPLYDRTSDEVDLGEIIKGNRPVPLLASIMRERD
jgi:hypothetical protein